MLGHREHDVVDEAARELRREHIALLPIQHAHPTDVGREVALAQEFGGHRPVEGRGCRSIRQRALTKARSASSGTTA